MSQNVHGHEASDPGNLTTNCANCHSPMPAGLRFCRNCGFRLGEGLAEYNETVRFQNGGGPITGVNTAIPYSAPIVAAATSPISRVGACSIAGRKRMSVIFWIFIGLAIFFACAGALTRLAKPHRALPIIQAGI